MESGAAYALQGEEALLVLSDVVFYTAVQAVEVSCPGSISVTNAQLLFRPDLTGNVLVALPLACVERLKKLKKGTQSEAALELQCKDLRTLRFGFADKTAYKRVSALLLERAYEGDIQKLFAFKWKPSGLVHWKYDALAEYERVGLHKGEHRVTNINAKYELCDSYPQFLAVPASAGDDLLRAVAKFRSRGRLPVATYRYAASGAAVYRCSQPLVGLKNARSADDEQLLHIMGTLPASNASSKLYIVDARPRAAAVGNRFRGAGVEHVGDGTRYANCCLEFLNIGNIHVMRGSLAKLMEAVMSDEAERTRYWQSVEASHWPEHINRVLSGAHRIAGLLEEGQPVLVHCTDGWDRTAQLTCLTEMMLDPYYRTIDGFCVLVEKEWISFGHKFAQRHGHGTFAPKWKDNQRAPIFLQFLDCVWQLLQQFPLSFEWNERFLLVVLDACYSCIFGTFLCNTDLERRQLYHVQENTTSLWSFVLSHKHHFVNPLFDVQAVVNTENPASHVLQPKLGPHLMHLWKTLYTRFKFRSINDLEGIASSTGCTIVTVNARWNRKLDEDLTHMRRASGRPASAQQGSARAAVQPEDEVRHALNANDEDGTTAAARAGGAASNLPPAFVQPVSPRTPTSVATVNFAKRAKRIEVQPRNFTTDFIDERTRSASQSVSLHNPGDGEPELLIPVEESSEEAPRDAQAALLPSSTVQVVQSEDAHNDNYQNDADEEEEDEDEEEDATCSSSEATPTPPPRIARPPLSSLEGGSWGATNFRTSVGQLEVMGQEEAAPSPPPKPSGLFASLDARHSDGDEVQPVPPPKPPGLLQQMILESTLQRDGG